MIIMSTHRHRFEHPEGEKFTTAGRGAIQQDAPEWLRHDEYFQGAVAHGTVTILNPEPYRQAAPVSSATPEPEVESPPKASASGEGAAVGRSRSRRRSSK